MSGDAGQLPGGATGPAGDAIGAPPPAPPGAAVREPGLAGDQEAGTAAVAAEPPAAPRSGAVAAAPAKPPPGPDPEEDPEPGTGRARPAWRARPVRPLSRLRIGQHAAPPAALDQLQLTGAWFGLRLGRSQDGSPVTVTLFRPEPVRVVLLGGAWAVRLIAYRSLAAGARVQVFTDQPAGWVDLGRRATGRTDRVAVLPPGAPAAVPGSADAPVLRLTVAGEPDGDDPVDPGELPGWTTRLSVPVPAGLARARTMAAVAGADLLLAERLTRPEATMVAAVRRLPVRTAYTLQVLQDGMLAVLTATRTRYAWTDPTPS